jgi:ubiquinone/menaquinone biosynthesis C-methylase UbiE
MTGKRHIQDQADGTYGSCEAAAAWQRSGAVRAQLLGPLTERMLDLTGVGVGDRVLDVGAGTGEQTLAAARRVGPSGAVLATDIAAQMLALAAEATAQAGLRNVETRVLDARDLDLEPESFDAAISRLVLMLIPERARAMAGIHRALKTGKRFAVVVLATAEECPFVGLPMGIAGRCAGTPQALSSDPGMFALGDPTRLAAAYRDAGFREVTVQTARVERRFPSLAAAMQNVRDILPEIPQLLMQNTDAERAAAWAEIEDALRQFGGDDEFVVPHAFLVGVGTK